MIIVSPIINKMDISMPKDGSEDNFEDSLV